MNYGEETRPCVWPNDASIGEVNAKQPTPIPMRFVTSTRRCTSNVSEYEAAFTRLARQALRRSGCSEPAPRGRLLDVRPDRVMSRLPRPRAERGLGYPLFRSDGCACPCDHPAVEFKGRGRFSFEDCSFDAVSHEFRMLHLARPERAMTEAARVLKPGGSFAFAVWADRSRQWDLKPS